MVALLTVSLNRLSAVSAIVAGAIAALLFLLGSAKWIWDMYRRPRLELIAGSGHDFDRRVGLADWMVRENLVDPLTAVDAHEKVIHVQETGGHSWARSVLLRVVDVSPPPPNFSVTSLKWEQGERLADVQPHGRTGAIVQFLVTYRGKDHEDQMFTTYSPTIFSHAKSVTFTVEVLVEGRKRGKARFRIDNPWSNERFDADGWPNPLPYPTITRLS